MQPTRSLLLVLELGDAGSLYFHGTKHASAVPIFHLQPTVYFQQFAFFGRTALLLNSKGIPSEAPHQVHTASLMVATHENEMAWRHGKV